MASSTVAENNPALKEKQGRSNEPDFYQASIANTASVAGTMFAGGNVNKNDTVEGSDGDDTIDSGAGNDFIFGRKGNDYLNGGVGDDTIYGNEDNDTLIGNAGNDYLSGDAGHDFLNGGSGDDYLSGGAGDDTLKGGLGNDDLNGGAGNDLYLYGQGGGKDVIYNQGADAATTDVLQFENIKSTDVLLRREGFDLLVKTKLATDTVRVKDHFDASNQFTLDQLRFSDGVTWDTAVMKAKVLIPTSGSEELWLDDVNSLPIHAGAGNDSVYGGFGSDSIDGGSGDDYILGGGGQDTINGGIGNDYIAGGDLADILIGNSGNDYLVSGKGNDSLIGGTGDDYLLAGEGNDTLDGGAGDDLMLGEAGSDTYIFAQGGGNDTINNYSASADSTDILKMINIKSTQVTVAKDGTDLILQVKNAPDSVRLVNNADIQYKLDQVQFSDGVVWDSATLDAKFNAAGALTANDVNQVVQAMASYSSNDATAFTNYSNVQQNQDLMNLVHTG